MKTRKHTSGRRGVALLVVLFIVMAITIAALGFVSQSDVELACGQNMVLHKQMDYLAESGLEHARGLILNPQDVAAADEYWKGGTSLQLTSGNDYYDVAVARNAGDRCNYTIDSNSYRLNGTEIIGRSSLRADLRLDPCVAYRVGSATTVRSKMTIAGDVYCGGNLTNSGAIDGDVFAAGTITGSNITGRKNGSVTSAPVAWPNLAVAEFQPVYYIGLTSYSAHQIVDANIPAPNPLTGVQYCAGSVNMTGNVTINGTLVVNGDLRVSGANNTISAAKNFPALLVTGQVVMAGSGSLAIQGLAQIGGPITADPNATNPVLNVTGALFVQTGGVTSDAISVNVVAAPEIAAFEIWSAGGVARRWGPAAGAFFRSIGRR